MKWQKKDMTFLNKIMVSEIFTGSDPFTSKTRKCFCICFSAYSLLQSACDCRYLKVLLSRQVRNPRDGVSTTSTVISWICVHFLHMSQTGYGFSSLRQRAKKDNLKLPSIFIAGRIFTLLVEMFMMWLGYSLLSFNYWVTKIVANVVVLILNYVISKLVVFRKK